MSRSQIKINHIVLSSSQVEAVRFACTTVHSELQDDNHLGTDAVGRAMTRNYRDRLMEVLKLIIHGEA